MCDNFPGLETLQWKNMNKVVFLLEGFKLLTVQCSAWSSTASDIIPSILTLDLNLASAKDEDGVFYYGILRLVNLLTASVQSRLHPLLEDKDLVAATFLDPRYRLQFMKVNKFEYITDISCIQISSLFVHTYIT